MPEEILFGAIAVKEGFITPAHLEKALTRQMTSSPPAKLGEILVRDGALTAERVDLILDIQRINIADRIEVPDSGGLFGQIAVRMGFLAEADVNDAVRLQQDLVSRGTPMMIGQILLQKGKLKYDQFIDVLHQQEKFTLRCPGCETTYLIEGLGQGTKFLCRKCMRVLTVPAFSATAVMRSTAMARDEAARPLERISGRTGESFGDYVIDTELGRSPGHVLFKARHRISEQPVALRVFLASDGSMLDRLKRNAERLRGLDHAGVAPFLEAGEIERRPYAAHEYVAGDSLAKLILRRQRPLPEVVGMLEQAARTLHAAHGLGYVHGDVRPSSILIDSAGKTRVTDFGIGGISDAGPVGHLTGMPYYLAPESFPGSGEPVDARSDVFSLGAILFEIISGRLPFTGPTADDVRKAVAGKTPAKPSTLKSDVPADLETICLRALEKKKAGRHPTAADFADDLSRWLGGRPLPPSGGGWLKSLFGLKKS